MRLSKHPFVADVRWPRECRICGRPRSAHEPDHEAARARAGDGAYEDVAEDSL